VNRSDPVPFDDDIHWPDRRRAFAVHHDYSPEDQAIEGSLTALPVGCGLWRAERLRASEKQGSQDQPSDSFLHNMSRTECEQVLQYK
jgi:hypothetical protein